MKKVLIYAVVMTVFLSCKKEPNTPQIPKLEIVVGAVNLPAGCTSTSGYSSITGAPCNSGVQTNIKISPTQTTNNVVILPCSMKATDGDIDVETLALSYTGTEAIGNVVSSARLYAGNVLLATSYSQNALLTFRGFLFHLNKDETKNLSVVVDIKKSNQNYANGTSCKVYVEPANVVAFGANNVAATVVVTDDPQRTPLNLYYQSVLIVMGAPTYSKTTDLSGNVTSVTYMIPVSVTPFGNTLYVGQSAQLATTVSGSNAFALAFQTSGAPTTDEITSSASITLSSSDAMIESNGFRLDDSRTEHFTITVVLTGPTTPNTSYRAVLKQFKCFTNAELTAGALMVDLLPKEQYRTDYQFINN